MEYEYLKRLYQLLNDYLNKHINTETFSNEFVIIFNLHIDYESLKSKELELFSELSEITARFSPFEDDLKEYDCYFNENDVEQKAKEVFEALC